MSDHNSTGHVHFWDQSFWDRAVTYIVSVSVPIGLHAGRLKDKSINGGVPVVFFRAFC